MRTEAFQPCLSQTLRLLYYQLADTDVSMMSTTHADSQQGESASDVLGWTDHVFFFDMARTAQETKKVWGVHRHTDINMIS
jgi:hypothetical protein